MLRTLLFGLLFLSVQVNAGEVLTLANFRAKPKPKPKCIDHLLHPTFSVVDGELAQRLIGEVVAFIRGVHAGAALMRIDFSGAIWDWMPLATTDHIEITFIRDRNRHPLKIMITRARGLEDYTVMTPSLIKLIEDELLIQREEAQIIVDPNIDELLTRPQLSEGLMF